MTCSSPSSAAEVTGADEGSPESGAMCGEKDGGRQGEQDKGTHTLTINTRIYITDYINLPDIGEKLRNTGCVCTSAPLIQWVCVY